MAQEGGGERGLAPSLCLKAGSKLLGIVDQEIHILGVRVSLGVAEKYGTEKCPCLQSFGGDVPDGDWEKNWHPRSEPISAKGIKVFSTRNPSHLLSRTADLYPVEGDRYTKRKN